MSLLARAAGIVVAAVVTAGLVWGSTAPLTVQDDAHGVIRVAWSVRPERIEECRARTAEELARLPQHMRQATVCVGQTAEYQLTVRRDGEVVVRQLVRGGGWRRDRPLYVFKEVPVSPGDSSIDVEFARTGIGGAPAAGSLRQADVAPAHLAYSDRVTVRAGEVVLITYAAEQRALIALRSPEPRR